MSNTIKLIIPENLTFLAGNELGRAVCSKQVIPNIQDDIENIIEFPEHIDGVAIGFVQGLKHCLSAYSDELIVHFKAKDKRLEDKLLRDYNY